MPVSGFRVKITLLNGTALPRMIARIRAGFEDVYHEIIERFTAHNEDKFDQAAGAQGTGTAFDSGMVIWKPLSPAYAAEKSAAGYNDWLMVREGDLIESLTNPDDAGWYEEVGDRHARFGTVLPQAGFNQETRPVMFLDPDDRQMTADMFGNYVGGEGPFREFVPPSSKAMTAEFRAIVGA